LVIAPALPDDFGSLRVTGLPLGDVRLGVDVDDGRVKVTDLPPGIELVTEPRRPPTIGATGHATGAL
jgi:hypothetical protein